MPGQFDGTRGEAQSYIPGLIEAGLNNTDVIKTLGDAGLSYRLKDMYSDVNRIRLEVFGAEGLKNFDIYTPVPQNLMREWQGDTEYKYRVVVQYEYMPSDGGESKKAATTLYYNNNPTINTVMEDWSVRVKTIEGGFGAYTNVKQIEGITEINYFYNTPKE